jgi:hypothetical protein
MAQDDTRRPVTAVRLLHMPIRKENRHRYPSDWREVVSRVRERSGDRCEQCGVPNRVVRLTYPDGTDRHVAMDALDDIGTAVEQYGAKRARIILTTAHLDHKPENCRLDNLRHLCQRCHNRLDDAQRRAGIAERRTASRRA